MRLVLQRVTRAAVSWESERNEIGRGLAILVGVFTAVRIALRDVRDPGAVALDGTGTRLAIGDEEGTISFPDVARASIAAKIAGDGRITALHRRMQLRHSESAGT